MVGPATPLWVCPPLAESQPSPGTSTPPNDGDESGDAGLQPASLLILALPSFAARTACCSFSNCWQKSSPNVSLVSRDACSSSRRLELSIDALSWPLCQLVVVQAPGCTGVRHGGCCGTPAVEGCCCCQYGGKEVRESSCWRHFAVMLCLLRSVTLSPRSQPSTGLPWPMAAYKAMPQRQRNTKRGMIWGRAWISKM